MITLGAGAPARADARQDRRRSAREPLVLFVGSIFNRRRVPDLICGVRAGARARAGRAAGHHRREPHVPAPGSRGALPRPPAPAIAFACARYVEDAELAEAFRTASVFAFLSEYEGFGLTPLEALARGVPPVVLDTPVAREVCGRAARYVAPGDIPATAAALVDLLTNPAARDAVLREAARGAVPLLVAGSGPRDPRGARIGGQAGAWVTSPSSSCRSTRGRNSRPAWRSIAAAPPSAAHRIVVVDNASSDGSPDAVRRSWPGVRLIASERNLGFAAANNIGIREAASEFVLLLNSDTLVPPGAIDALLRALDCRRRRRGRGPAPGRRRRPPGALLRPDDGTVQRAAAEAARTPATIAARARPFAGSAVRCARRHYPDWVSGACLLVRRADALAAGLLDERYFLYAEDVDFCAALRALGRRILFTPDAEVVHLRGASGRARPQDTERALPAQPGGVLREAPPGVGAAPACVSPAARRAA